MYQVILFITSYKYNLEVIIILISKINNCLTLILFTFCLSRTKLWYGIKNFRMHFTFILILYIISSFCSNVHVISMSITDVPLLSVGTLM